MARVRRTVAGALLPALAAIALSGAGCGGGPQSERPSAEPAADISPRASPTAGTAAGFDVLLLTIDTLRADALGSYGNPRGATPWLDRLAASGVRFDDAHAHNVTTLPSHATMLSGLHPHEHGVRDNSGFRFPREIETLATLLAARGYRTGAFVSAFPLDSRFGLDRGFEVYDDSFVAAGLRPAFVEQERSGTATVERARRWLEAAGEQPSFAWVHLYEPHFPYEPPPPFERRFADDRYLGEVAAADAALEPLLAPLLAAGANGDNLVIATSDHGEALGEHGEATHGIFAYESTLRVPLILFAPRVLPPRVVDSPARLVDLLPTLLDLLALEEPAGLSGLSLVPAAVGDSAGDAIATYFEALSGQLNRGWAPLSGVIRDRWKYIRLPLPELYDLSTDPGEERNLVATERNRATDLQRLLDVFAAADRGAEPAPEDAEARRKLESLGYLSGRAALRETYSEEDDPKLLIGLDADLRAVTAAYAAGDLETASTGCRELVRKRPGMRMALMMLAQIERDLGNLDAAVSSMRAAFELLPADTTALGLLASYLTQAGRPGEAVELTDPHAGGGQPDVEVLLVRGLALARSGRPGEAMAAIERARAIEPDNPLVAVHAGTLHLMAGRQGDARAAFEQALALDPDAVRAHTSLAIMATENGRSQEALEHWRRAVELDRREYSKLLSVGARLWSTGRRDEARPLLELFADSAPRASFGSEVDKVRDLLSASS